MMIYDIYFHYMETMVMSWEYFMGFKHVFISWKFVWCQSSGENSRDSPKLPEGMVKSHVISLGMPKLTIFRHGSHGPCLARG